MWSLQQAECDKRKELIKQLNKSFSNEHVQLNRCAEMAKKEIEKESLRDIKEIDKAQKIVRKDIMALTMVIEGSKGGDKENSLGRRPSKGK
jgi:ribosome recycling factor